MTQTVDGLDRICLGTCWIVRSALSKADMVGLEDGRTNCADDRRPPVVLLFWDMTNVQLAEPLVVRLDTLMFGESHL